MSSKTGISESLPRTIATFGFITTASSGRRVDSFRPDIATAMHPFKMNLVHCLVSGDHGFRQIASDRRHAQNSSAVRDEIPPVAACRNGK